MTNSMSISRQIRLARYPDAMIQPADLTIADTPLPAPGPNDLVVRNRWFRVSISTRLMARRDAQAVEGIPFPALKPGDALADGAIGEVLSCPSDSAFSIGDFVSHSFGWRDLAVVPIQQCVPLGRGPIEPAAYLGHGWTAYAALTRAISLREGDTVFISSGAGAIGSMAGQIARRLGAGRVIGSTGSRDKAGWMRSDLGYDAVILRDAGPLTEQLAAAAPGGIDVFIDMVGGEQLSAAVTAARQGARFVLLGALTSELDRQGASIVAPATLDSFQLILKGITLRGYSADNDIDAFPEWIAWQRDAKLHFASSMVTGLEAAPQALHDASEGRLRGVVIVAL